MSISTEKQNKWANICKEWKDKWPVFTDDYNDGVYGLNIYSFIEGLNSAMTDKHIVVTDAGSPSYALPQNLKCKSNQRFIFSASQADMGFSVPGSIGVAKANPNKHIIVVTGDGSFNTNLQELSVIKSHNLPITIFVLDNNGYLSIKNTQKKFFENRVYGVSPTSGIVFADLLKVSKLYGLEFFFLHNKKSLIDDINFCISNPLPRIVKVRCLEEQEIVPTQMFKEVNGKRIQPGLDDMYPFLTEKEYLRERKKALTV